MKISLSFLLSNPCILVFILNKVIGNNINAVLSLSLVCQTLGDLAVVSGVSKQQY